VSRELLRAARRLRRLGYLDVRPYGSAGLSATHGQTRWHFYSADVVRREAAKARTARRATGR
jgi:hypothetical protein